MEQEQSAYITSLHLKGYKSIRDLSVDLKQGLNIIIGANGSGKTNFFAFLDAACKSKYSKLFNGQNRRFEYEILGNLYSWKIKGLKVFQSEVKGASYRIERSKFSGKEQEDTVRAYFGEDMNEIKSEKNTLVPTPFFKTMLLQFNNPLINLLEEKLSLSLSRHNQFSDENEEICWNLLYFTLKKVTDTFIDDIFYTDTEEIEWGLKLNTIIAKITNNQWFIIDELRQNLKQFSPIKDIRFDWILARITVRDEEDGDESGSIDGFDFQFYVNGEWINWSQLSDGTKRLFYLIGSVTYAEINEIILIEEPELGIHPHQLSSLMNFLKAQSSEKQIIITTHSPQVLNCLKSTELDRIIVARHEGKAGTKMYHLSEEEKGYASQYMENEAFLSDYWMQSGFMNEEPVENL